MSCMYVGELYNCIAKEQQQPNTTTSTLAETENAHLHRLGYISTPYTATGWGSTHSRKEHAMHVPHHEGVQTQPLAAGAIVSAVS
jgi:hypothetical protein